MRDRLVALGWSQIETIDDDLGRSAAGGTTRTGFDRMVAEVCLGKVGAVVTREVSRFARNSRDWQQPHLGSKIVEAARSPSCCTGATRAKPLPVTPFSSTSSINSSHQVGLLAARQALGGLSASLTFVIGHINSDRLRSFGSFGVPSPSRQRACLS